MPNYERREMYSRRGLQRRSAALQAMRRREAALQSGWGKTAGRLALIGSALLVVKIIVLPWYLIRAAG